MPETPQCVHCGALFEMNYRSRRTHRYCSNEECQKERRRLAQGKRRARKRQGGKAGKRQGAPMSTAGKRLRATYMREYRRQHLGYRQREMELARARRQPASAPVTTPPEAASGAVPADVYVTTDEQGGVALRLVTRAGAVFTCCLGRAS